MRPGHRAPFLGSLHRSRVVLALVGALPLTACSLISSGSPTSAASSPTPTVVGTTVGTPTESSPPATTVTVTVTVPTVTVGRGAGHQTSTCTVAACAYVQVTTSGFASRVTCRITEASVDVTNFSPWKQGPNTTKDSPNYYGWPGKSITVSCTDGTNTASGTDPSW